MDDRKSMIHKIKTYRGMLKKQNENKKRVIEYIDGVIESSKKYPYSLEGTLLIVRKMLKEEM